MMHGRAHKLGHSCTSSEHPALHPVSCSTSSTGFSGRRGGAGVDLLSDAPPPGRHHLMASSDLVQGLDSRANDLIGCLQNLQVPASKRVEPTQCSILFSMTSAFLCPFTLVHCGFCCHCTAAGALQVHHRTARTRTAQPARQLRPTCLTSCFGWSGSERARWVRCSLACTHWLPASHVWCTCCCLQACFRAPAPSLAVHLPPPHLCPVPCPTCCATTQRQFGIHTPTFLSSHTFAWC